MDNLLRSEYGVYFDQVKNEWIGLTEAKWRRIVKAYQSQHQAVRGLGVGRGSLQRFEDKYGIGWPKTFVAADRREIEPAPNVARLERPRLDWGDFIIAPDLHIPYHNAALLNEMCRFARKHKIKKLLIAGDANDFKDLYTKDVQNNGSVFFKNLKSGEDVLDRLGDCFDEIVMLMGNHDWRLLRLVGSVEGGAEIYRKFTSLATFSEYNYVLMNGWLSVVHPFKMRKAKGSFTEELGDHHWYSHLMAHSHRYSFGVHDNGRELSCEGLHLTDPELHDYIMKRLDTFSAWVPGFWYVIGNKLGAYTKHDRIYNPMGV